MYKAQPLGDPEEASGSKLSKVWIQLEGEQIGRRSLISSSSESPSDFAIKMYKSSLRQPVV